MADDLKKLAEAAKAAEDTFGVENARPSHDLHLPSDEWLEAYIAWGAASGSLHEAATPDVILNLIRERDEARALAADLEQANRREHVARAAALSAARARIAALEDKVDGLEADLDAAVMVAFKYGAVDWTRLNYPAQYATLTKEQPHG